MFRIFLRRNRRRAGARTISQLMKALVRSKVNAGNLP